MAGRPSLHGVGAATFEAAVAAHDAAVAAKRVRAWLGAEPTFTSRFSNAWEWIGGAAGDEKESIGRTVVARLAANAPGAAVLRTLGRIYPGEDRARWSYGIYARRDARPVWQGPPDPLLGASPSAGEVGPALRDAVAERLRRAGVRVHELTCERRPRWRLHYATQVDFEVADRAEGRAETVDEADCERPSVHESSAAAAVDELAAAGCMLLGFDDSEVDGEGVFPRVELPGATSVEALLAILSELGPAALDCGLPALVLAGYPPAVDAGVSWTTVTPDPAVVEINMAPSSDLASFLEQSERLYAAAVDCGLDSKRYYYNGDLADSGGGGHLTFGGPSAAESPFFEHPMLLPRLIAYLVRHPSLSYFFAAKSVGSSGQSPRVDETSREAFSEIALALELLGRHERPTPEILDAALAPFLADRFGNSHRTEINIEKLWNPSLPGRGCLGLVELRAHGMAPTAESLTARAALFRALLAMLSAGEHSLALQEWGSELHARFSLPFYLERDLAEVLADLDGCELGLEPPIVEQLFTGDPRMVGSASVGAARLEVRRGIEFWPLVGDLSDQGATARLVDASTLRLELRLIAAHREDIGDLELRIGGWSIPLRDEVDGDEVDTSDAVRVGGLRYRSFVPQPGFHPTLPAYDPLELACIDRRDHSGWTVALHSWRDDGELYDGLPRDAEDASRRREERFLVAPLDAESIGSSAPPPAAAYDGYSLDARWM